MMDTWTDRLSEYLDGELAAAERSALDAHLAGCAQCRAVLAELQQVVRHAAALPAAEPPRDLWPDIAARLGPAAAARAGEAERHATTLAGESAPVWPAAAVPASRPRPLRRRAYAFTVPQLAAAAVALMLFSGTAVWQLAGNRAARAPGALADGGAQSGTSMGAGLGAEPVTRAPAGGVVLTGAGIEARYADAIAELEAALGDARAYLDPQTIATLEQSLVAVEAALDDARAALEADPGSAFLARHLENTTLRKLELLRAAGRVTVQT